MFSLARPGSVLHSYAAKGFIVAASIYQMIHLLCSKHWHRKIEQLHASLCAKYVRFKKRSFELIYNSYSSLFEFDAAFQSLRSELIESAVAVQVLDDLCKHREALMCLLHQESLHSWPSSNSARRGIVCGVEARKEEKHHSSVAIRAVTTVFAASY